MQVVLIAYNGWQLQEVGDIGAQMLGRSTKPPISCRCYVYHEWQTSM